MDYSRLHKKLQPNFDILIPFVRFEQELERELLLSHDTIIQKNSKFFIVPSRSHRPLWAQDWLTHCQVHEFNGKSQAVKILKAMDNLGVYFETEANNKLAHGIRKELRELKVRRINFEAPSAFNFKYFAWGLLDDTHLIICPKPQSQFPLGWHEFNEDKEIPPNRAYLKLWELLCLNHIQLKPDDIAIDVGSSPGGWSWALSQFVKKVYSVDKAPLDKKIAARSNILYSAGDAFALNPADYPGCTWFFSDIICTPERLLSLVEQWHAQSNVKNFVCTIKFKGPCDFEILKKFLTFENSRIIHLYQNKNEVTWIQQVKP